MTYETMENSNNKSSHLFDYTLKEEIVSSIIHGIGFIYSIAALVILVAFASIKGDVSQIVSFSIYGSTLIFLFMSSTLYHSILHEKSKRILRVFDHAAIYLVIAGSYTPIALVAIQGTLGWIIFGGIWFLAMVGILSKIFILNRSKIFSAMLYAIMGWLIVFAAKPMLAVVPTGFFIWLLVGGLVYTIGILFYVLKKIPFNHCIWHVFVLGGSIIHFLGILFYLAL